MREIGLDEEEAYLRLQRPLATRIAKLAEVARAVIMADQLKRDGTKGSRGPGHTGR